MLTIKQISERFDIPKSTLYGWEKERPKVFEYLQQSSSNQDILRELTIILEKYSKNLNFDFLLDEIEYILDLNLENHLENIEKLHTIYIEQTSKELKENSEFILSIYQKIQNLNLIERYIFISRIKSIKKQKIKKNELKTAIKHYFKEFLK
jgi:DNA-binding transcriptional MerR regulator